MKDLHVTVGSLGLALSSLGGQIKSSVEFHYHLTLSRRGAHVSSYSQGVSFQILKDTYCFNAGIGHGIDKPARKWSERRGPFCFHLNTDSQPKWKSVISFSIDKGATGELSSLTRPTEANGGSCRHRILAPIPVLPPPTNKLDLFQSIKFLKCDHYRHHRHTDQFSLPTAAFFAPQMQIIISRAHA